MPSSITHAYIAMNVYDKLDKNIQRKLLNRLEDYKTYSQGPDVFYFYHMLQKDEYLIEYKHRQIRSKAFRPIKMTTQYHSFVKVGIMWTF